MGTFGYFAVKAQMSGAVNVSDFLEQDDEAGAIIALVSSIPLPRLFMVVLLFISFVFLATTMDSSAFATVEMTAVQSGSEDLAPRWLRLVWAVATAVIAFIVIQLGGAQAVRSVCYIAGLPHEVVLPLGYFQCAKEPRRGFHELAHFGEVIVYLSADALRRRV